MAPVEDKPTEQSRRSSGFHLLLTIGALDTATRMGYLLFPPFLLHARGGALGKAARGWLGEHLVSCGV